MTEIWEILTGRQLAVVGPESEQKSIFQENLVMINTRSGGTIRVTGQLEAAAGQYVILFAAAGDRSGMQELRSLLLRLTELRPASVVLVTDHTVYGKVFGETQPLKEQELGYLCHTKKADESSAGLRAAEHFACRLAREEHLPVTVVRIPAEQLNNEKSECQLKQILTILLHGKAGEVYNLPGECPEMRESPLTAAAIKVDASKAEAICY